MKKRVLITGHTSFAAQGLAQRLVEKGFRVDCFSRRFLPVADDIGVVVGDAPSLHLADGLAATYDVVINFLLIKDGDVAANEKYIHSLVTLCRDRRVGHLIHISSISVYPASATMITERSEMEADPAKKGSYGSLKVATDLLLLQQTPADTCISFVRPGFILAPGLTDPIVGMAFRTPYNRLLLLGRSTNTVPLASRDHVHQVIEKLTEQPVEAVLDRQPWLIVDPDSPSRLRYLQTLCEKMGFGEGVIRFPAFLWRLAGAGGNVIAMITGMKLRPYKILSAACRQQVFDSSFTMQKLGVELNTNWPSLLSGALDGQGAPENCPAPLSLSRPAINSIAWLGFGRIVRQKHLPALRKLKLSPAVFAYDLVAGMNSSGQEVLDIRGEIQPADVYIVATPGPVHAEVIPRLPKSSSPVLVEKPLAYTREEMASWKAFAASRPGPVTVCHNYRFKPNVQQMLKFLQKFNPGELKHVNLVFQSPPIANESAVWLRNERLARTLLMDYGIHFLDLACLFSRSPIQLSDVRFELNKRGETSLIQGSATSESTSVSFLLRQGAIPRKAVIHYVFQNYETRLSFFPDVFSADMSGESSFSLRKTAGRIAAGVRRKIFDKLSGWDSDDSHAKAIAAAFRGEHQLTVEGLSHFYEFLFDVADHVYESKADSVPSLKGNSPPSSFGFAGK
jgi:nucleoside-diphosphate-sugar epimerase